MLKMYSQKSHWCSKAWNNSNVILTLASISESSSISFKRAFGLLPKVTHGTCLKIMIQDLFKISLSCCNWYQVSHNNRWKIKLTPCLGASQWCRWSGGAHSPPYLPSWKRQDQHVMQLHCNDVSLGVGQEAYIVNSASELVLFCLAMKLAAALP